MSAITALSANTFQSKMRLSSRFLLSHALLIVVLHVCSCLEIDRATTGVVFSPYAKKGEAWTNYDMKEIKTAMEVVFTKFSRIATYGVGTPNDDYEQNKTYHKSSRVALSAEAAALINKERKNKSITVLVGIWQSAQPTQMTTEIKVALESAQIANAIYPGTVEGVIFSHSDARSTSDRTEQTLEQILLHKNDFASHGLKIGTRIDCYDIYSRTHLVTVKQKIANESDFIICQVKPDAGNQLSGAVSGFSTIGSDLPQFRKQLRTWNPKIEVMGETGWASKGSHAYENIGNLREYWITVNKWASEKKFTMWLLEAFDNPWKDYAPDAAYLGWWKLKQNSLANTRSGYVEKINEPPEKEEVETATNWVLIGAIAGGLVLLLFFALITMLFFRVNKLQEAVTKEDVKDFIFGISDDAAAQGGQAIESALKFPYDKSYEISKELLKIKKDVLLGSGEFGCVYKALIDNEEQTEVAIKMTKSECPKTALKSLLSEIKILTYLGKHPNIVSIHGAYTAELTKGIVYVATELCTFGSLENYLRNEQSSNYGNMPNTNSSDRYANAPTNVHETEFSKRKVTYNDMVKWSHEIACGMEYLGTKHVVHADLASRNVLLTSDKTAKITDFGLSRRLYDYTNYVKKQQEPLPWRWMAIEALKRLEFSPKSDVWSYGVTLWEIFAMGDIPFPGLSWNLDFVDELVNGLRMKSPPHAKPEIYKIMVDCWHFEPNQRPTFTDLKLSTGDLIGASGSTVASEYSYMD